MALVCEYPQVAISEESGIKKIIIATENGNKEYAIPFAAMFKVKEGDVVEPGTILTVGSINPHDILKTKGVKGVQEYLCEEVSRSTATRRRDKRQAHRDNRAPDAQESQGGRRGRHRCCRELVDINKFEEENEKVIVNGGSPPRQRGCYSASPRLRLPPTASSLRHPSRRPRDAHRGRHQEQGRPINPSRKTSS